MRTRIIQIKIYISNPGVITMFLEMIFYKVHLKKIYKFDIIKRKN